MSAPQWAWEAGRCFWGDIGGWSRDADLEEAIDRAGLPIRVDEVAGLSPGRVREHLARRHCSIPHRMPDRGLRGCLVVSDDSGWIFIEANDPDDERRFSLAHELAHYLRHHLGPQRASGRGLAGQLRGVLRGERSMTFLHLMERGEGFLLPEVREAEEEADWLAVELLAPEEELSPRLSVNAGRDEIVAVLSRTFGLPLSAASIHAARLVPIVPECPLIERLKKKH